MNKKFYIPFAALALAACTNNDLLPEGNHSPEENVSVSKYLSLNVYSSPSTRADEDYVNGTTSENAVYQVRFFFFDANGQPFPVWENKSTGNNNYNSYLDWYPNASEGTTGDPDSDSDTSIVKNETVEKILNVTLGLVMPANLSDEMGSQPSSVLAVLNPPASVQALTTSSSVNTGASTLTINGPSLETLRSTVADYTTGLTSSGSFVMSNSVYVDNGNIVDATVITEDNYGANEEEAEADPITIYVERVISRLDFILALTNSSTTLSDGTPIYYLGQYNVFNGTVNTTGETEDIYVKLLGWNVTGVANNSRLVKSVNPAWTNSDVFGSDATVWNSVDFHRSFWAINPDPDTSSFGYLYGDFNGSASTSNPYPASGNLIQNGVTQYITYVQENANAYNVTNNQVAPMGPDYATAVIIAAQLVDETGNPYPMCEYNYQKYTLPQLQAKLITTVFSNLYSRSQTGGTTTYNSITANDFTFATANTLGIDEEDEANYYVYPVLSTTGAQLTWTMGNSENAAVMTTEQVNTYMRDAINHVMVWNNGMTYYFFPVQHLGKENYPAYYGIVRNHLYLSTLKSLKGLGTPVYEASETIYPEKTESDDNIVTASVQILQWRIVAQVYNLEW